MSSVLNGFEGQGRAYVVSRSVAKAGSPVSVLIAGQEGSGQREVARFLAAALLCLQPSNGEACGDCRPCRAVQKGISGDLLLIEPSGKSDWINVGWINPVKDRPAEGPSVREFLRVGPVQARYKVVVIHEVERLTPDAGNALLKLLEETPEYARFILTTSAASKLQPTIRSRCLLIACESSSLGGDADPVLVLWGGSKEGMEPLAGEDGFRFAQEFLDWVGSLGERPRVEALKASEEFQEFAKSYRSLRGETDDEGERAVRAEFMGLFAKAVARELRQGRLPARILERAVEAHRAVQGNVRFEYVVDSMFVECLRD